ncbi:hypothetical protein A6R70_24760 [Agrobacterium rubi]|nr:hypothetical protein [Agrobacterium rubi]
MSAPIITTFEVYDHLCSEILLFIGEGAVIAKGPRTVKITFPSPPSNAMWALISEASAPDNL